MGDLTPHFSRAEFVDRRTGHQYGPPPELLLLLEKIRDEAGKPLPVVSGHRCCGSNAAVGGAPMSRHIAGDAADIPAGFVRPDRAFELGARGVGVRAGWAVHVDVRPGPVARWTY